MNIRANKNQLILEFPEPDYTDELRELFDNGLPVQTPYVNPEFVYHCVNCGVGLHAIQVMLLVDLCPQCTKFEREYQV